MKGYALFNILGMSVLAVGVVAFGAGCATSTVNIRTQPAQAEIFVSKLGDNKPQLVGKTPFTVKGPELERLVGTAGPFYLEARKDGYNSANAVITGIPSVDMLINFDLRPANGLEDPDKLNGMVDLLFESQRLAKIGRFNEAIDKLKQAEKQTPQVAAVYELQGGVYYLQKRFKEALDAYTTAAKFNPKNLESIRMRNVLRASLNMKQVGGGQ